MTFQKTTRREAFRMCIAGLAAAYAGRAFARASRTAANSNTAPALAPGPPDSPERIALINGFRKRSEGLQDKFEARTYKGDWTMPYRLFRPEADGRRRPR